jgi:competence protein ComEA
VDRINEKLNEFKLPIGLLLVGGVLLIGGVFSSNLIQKPETQAPENFPKESLVSESQLSSVKIDVAGAVNSPGVFSLNKESRIEDAIKMAGGFSDKASREYVSKRLNLSQKLSDGLKIYIPFEGEALVGSAQAAGVPAVAGAATSVSASGKIGVNSADQASLESLPGVGPVTAKKIIDSRPYASLEELLSKKAVSKAVYTKILELVDLN